VKEVTANEYSVENRIEMIISVIEALEAYRVVP
jgi:hypothetical protein